MPGIKKIFIASGLRYDLAVESPEYVKELVTHHVGGYLKIAPEHTEQGPLSKMMKPGMGTYDRFKEMFDRYSREAGKEQYLIPYFIAAHPGTTDNDMLNLALWLKRNGFRADQVQAFLPSPMSIATAMYHSGKDTLISGRIVSGFSVSTTAPVKMFFHRPGGAFSRVPSHASPRDGARTGSKRRGTALTITSASPCWRANATTCSAYFPAKVRGR